MKKIIYSRTFIVRATPFIDRASPRRTYRRVINLRYFFAPFSFLLAPVSVSHKSTPKLHVLCVSRANRLIIIRNNRHDRHKISATTIIIILTRATQRGLFTIASPFGRIICERPYLHDRPLIRSGS